MSDSERAYLEAAAQATIIAGESIVQKTIENFRAGIRGAVRGLWTGQTDRFRFTDTMISTIERNLRQAWHAGAAECGIMPDELTVQEQAALTDLVRQQFVYIQGFADDIIANSRAEGGKLTPLFSRAEMWINRWNEARFEGQTRACADQKLKWVLGNAEHCSSCLKLAGKVKRASFWSERGILPRVAGASFLECRGYRCACDLISTDERLSPGPLPSLP